MKRRALSLIELLVAIAIVAVLVGLLLAAIQKARYRAAVLKSEHALRQITLACHAYDGDHGRLPGTGLTLDANGEPCLFFDILPYLEESNVYREFTVGPGGAVTTPAAPGTGPARVIAVYVSPADDSLPDRTAGGLGCTSYTPNRGAFLSGASLGRSFPRGTSQTILFSERLMMCKGVPNPWYRMAPEFLVFGAAPMPSNFGPTVEGCSPERCSSPSALGIVVAMADGSVRFVNRPAATDNWVVGCDPEDTAPFSWTW